MCLPCVCVLVGVFVFFLHLIIFSLCGVVSVCRANVHECVWCVCCVESVCVSCVFVRVRACAHVHMSFLFGMAMVSLSFRHSVKICSSLFHEFSQCFSQ